VSVAFTHWLPAVWKVTLTVAIPLTRGVFPGKDAAPSEEEKLTVGVALATKYPLTSTA
jgi:hypothetical protein